MYVLHVWVNFKINYNKRQQLQSMLQPKTDIQNRSTYIDIHSFTYFFSIRVCLCARNHLNMVFHFSYAVIFSVLLLLPLIISVSVFFSFFCSVALDFKQSTEITMQSEWQWRRWCEWVNVRVLVWVVCGKNLSVVEFKSSSILLYVLNRDQSTCTHIHITHRETDRERERER